LSPSLPFLPTSESPSFAFATTPTNLRDRVNHIEQEIQAGLIEEIILVAEFETALVDTMYKSKVWEDLEESPNQGQWAYYERDTHTPKTQAHN
jgi:NADH dehydrogenase (ubiquinone) 1 alpha subcomplex subunit 5